MKWKCRVSCVGSRKTAPWCFMLEESRVRVRRPQGRHKRNQPNAGFILFSHETGPIFYSSCCMAHVIYSGPFGVMKFIQRLNIPPALQAPPESQWITVHRLGAYHTLTSIMYQLHQGGPQSSSTLPCPPHEVPDSTWCLRSMEMPLVLAI